MTAVINRVQTDSPSSSPASKRNTNDSTSNSASHFHHLVSPARVAPTDATHLQLGFISCLQRHTTIYTIIRVYQKPEGVPGQGLVFKKYIKEGDGDREKGTLALDTFASNFKFQMETPKKKLDLKYKIIKLMSINGQLLGQF
jgi:hypothetical protein